MIRSLRARLLIGVAPLLAITVGLGLWAVAMFARLGGNVEVILKENYASVRAAQGMKEALARIDLTLLTVALRGHDAASIAEFRRARAAYDSEFGRERRNVTIHPKEDQLVGDLARLGGAYLDAAGRFLDDPGSAEARGAAFGRLRPEAERVREIVDAILVLNQRNMEDMDRQARTSASASTRWMILGLVAASVLGTALALGLGRSLLGPIGDVTRAARSLAAGDLDQVIPVMTQDELGELASAFNAMARTIREYRRAGTEQLLRAQRTAQATIDAIPDPVVVVDPAGIVERANPAAARLLGVSASGGSAAPWEPPAAISAALGAAIAGSTSPSPSFEQALTIRDEGQERHFLPRALPIRDEAGDSLGAAVVLTDVTRLRRVDQLKTDMVATVSHELKTPLTSVQMAVHLLLEEVVGPLTTKQIDLLMAARQDADRLLAMVDDLLDLSRIEQGRVRLDLRPESAADLIGDVADRFGPIAADLGVRIEPGEAGGLPPLAVDRERIGLAFGNLVDNALKYSPRGGRVRIGAEAAGRSVRFVVADDGPGIAPEDLERVFDKFYRAPGDRPSTGAGLGLAIAREVVEAHGGTLSARPGQGTGATFVVELPAEPGGGSAR